MPNYVTWPNQQWAFTHMRELIASAHVEAGETAAPLVRNVRDLSGIKIDFGGNRFSINDYQQAAHIDGLMIVHRGEVVHEFYADHMRPTSRHMGMSVTKSFIGALAGILIDRGLLSLDGLVTDYLPYLAGSSWDGCTITNLLDMTAGTSFDETDYENVESPSGVGFRILGWPPVRDDDPLPRDYIRDLPNTSAHDVRFEYRSILTIVLTLCMEEVTGKPTAELLSELLWRPMGAQFDADLLMGRSNVPITTGGLCLALSDLARFGQLHLNEGRAWDGTAVIPQWWLQRLRSPVPRLLEFFAASPEAEGFPPTAFYHDKFWIYDAEAGIYMASGIYGQQLFIHHPSQTLIAKFSSCPHPLDMDILTLSAIADFTISSSLDG
jgi:CubicO group peptidase (beta-lactamase class C family)